MLYRPRFIFSEKEPKFMCVPTAIASMTAAITFRQKRSYI